MIRILNNEKLADQRNNKWRGKILNFKSYKSYLYCGRITVRQIELKAQNFKNKTVKQQL